MQRPARSLRTLLVVALAAALCIPAPAFAGPATSGVSLLGREGFEPGTTPKYTMFSQPWADGSEAVTWGPITSEKNSVYGGSTGLWCSGSDTLLASTYPTYGYSYYASSEIRFDLPQMADYYTGDLSYYFINPSMGAADDFYANWGVAGSQFSAPARLGTSASWRKVSYDLGSSPYGLSRRAGYARIRFENKPMDADGLGPTIDDVEFFGWKYGPPREFTSVAGTSAVQLSWKRPYSSTTTTALETRPILYKAWWADGGSSAWNDITPSVSSAAADLTLSQPIRGEGRQYRYSVQTWDANGAYGHSSEVTVSVPSNPPGISLASPSADFVLSSSPVLITGTASDIGTGVRSVGVRIRRADGQCFTGTPGVWTSADTWLAVQPRAAGDWSTWSYSWTPSAADLASGQIVSVTSRATDGTPLTTVSGTVSSQVPMVASVALAAGAATTTQGTVQASISAPGASVMRWSVDGGASWTGWSTYSTAASVVLPPGDGAKLVTFQFSKDGGATIAATASDGITLDTQAPSVALTSPSTAFSLNGPVTVAGTAFDAVGAVSSVSVRVQRADGLTWNGTAWTATETWLPVTTSDGYATWQLAWTPDASVRASGRAVTLTARAVDAAGLTGSSAGVTSRVPVVASMALNTGDTYASGTTVVASIATTGTPNRMRWNNGTGYNAWEPYSASKAVTLTAGDGVKTVTFEFSSAGDGTTDATASDSILLHTSVPSVAIAQPANGFSLTSVPVTITGTAADAGGSLTSVEVLITRSDGYTWTGSGWSSATSWIPATGTGNWSYRWAPSAGQLAAGQIISISARATDMVGLVGSAATVSSSVSVAAAVSLNGGAAYTTSTGVTASLATTGTPNKMRWSVDSGATFTGWQDYAPSAAVSLPSGDGTKTVIFELSSTGGASVEATASDSILLHTSIPEVALATPASGFSLNTPLVHVSGTSSDVDGIISSTELRIRRSDGRSWNGLAWTPGDFWLPMTGIGWSYDWAVPPTDQLAGYIVSVTARATDGVGLQGTSAQRDSSVGIAAAVSLQAGAAYTTTRGIIASVATTGTPTHMQMSFDGSAFSAWEPYASATGITLPAGDGVKRVWFRFSSTGGASVEASASDDIVLHTSVPSVAISSPAAGFRLSANTTRISGTAADTGGTVQGVEVLIRRSSGRCWNGSGWNNGAEVWLPVTGGASWYYDWTLTPDQIIPGEMVTLEAHATDGYGLVSVTTPGVVSAVPIAAQIALNGGDRYTGSQTVTATVSAVGATSVSYQVDGGAPSEWMPYGGSSAATLSLGAGEGTRTVTFRFSSDASHTVGATASDSIVLDTSAPSATIAQANVPFPLTREATVTLSGTASDSRSGIDAASIAITRDAMYWSGAGWQPEPIRLPVTVNPDGSWETSWTPDEVSWSGYRPVKVEFVAYDGAGNESARATRLSVDPKESTQLSGASSASVIAYGGSAAISGSWSAVESGALPGKTVFLEYLSGSWRRVDSRQTDAAGKVSFTVKPTVKTSYRLTTDADADFEAAAATQVFAVTPKVYLSTPYAPSRTGRNVRFSTYGNLKPRHSSGTYAVKLQCYRYESGKPKLRKTISVKVKNYSSYSRYYGYVSLPYTGKWIIRAYHADTAHAPSYSTFRTVYVR